MCNCTRHAYTGVDPEVEVEGGQGISLPRLSGYSGMGMVGKVKCFFYSGFYSVFLPHLCMCSMGWIIM